MLLLDLEFQENGLRESRVKDIDALHVVSQL